MHLITKTKKKKLYLIGIDSAPLWIIQKLYKKYNMKGFGYFINDGTLREMESTVPPVTAAAWPTIYTGRHPKDHGIMDFLHIDKNYTRRLIYYEPEKHVPFWERLAAQGKKCLVVTPAMVLQKSKSRNVDMITGWPLQPSFGSRELEDAAKRFGFKGEPDIGVDLDKRTIALEKAVKLYTGSIKARSEMSKYLMEKNDYDMAFVCFTETDRIQHYTLNRHDWERYTAPLYKGVSDFAEWVLNHSRKNGEDALIMLVSDHGAQPVRNKFLINTWLIEKGYASLKAEKKGSAAKSGVIQDTKRYVSERIMKLKIRRAVYNAMPAFMKSAVEKMIDESLEEGQDAEHLKIQETDFDMQNTKAFAAVSYGPVGMIWINDGRFARPAVSKTGNERIKAEITKKLSRLKSKDGSKLVTRIIDGSKYYKGARSFISPDIILELASGTIIDFSYYSSSGIFMKPELHRSGDHTKNGIIGLVGNNKTKDNIDKEVSINEIHNLIIRYFS
ncbi:MAG: alkaline phosphatase family protein [Candidatus Micrarchaeaceae archaeon]